MRDYSGFVIVKISSDIDEKKFKKALKTGKISFTSADLNGDKPFLVHPENAKKIMKAKMMKKGTNINISGGEIMGDLDYYDNSGAGNVYGGSFWSWLKKAGKDVFKWGKSNWDILKPVVSKLADVAVPAVATYFGQPGLTIPAREGLKQLSGIGIKKMTRAQALEKARMAKKNKVNIMTGSSFLIN